MHIHASDTSITAFLVLQAISDDVHVVLAPSPIRITHVVEGGLVRGKVVDDDWNIDGAVFRLFLKFPKV